VAEVQKACAWSKALTGANVQALRDKQSRSVVPLKSLVAEARRLEGQVADLVHMVYGLTPEEVAFMRRKAPPRMPCEPSGPF